MSTFWDSCVSRRALLGVGSIAVPTLLTTRFARGQGSEPEVGGDCEDESSVEMLFDWRAGKPVYPSVADAAPQIGWEPFNHPSLLPPFLIPPDWTGIASWADSFTRDGVPEWQDTPLQLPQLTSSRIVSPDGDAVFEYAVGSLQQVLLSTMESAQLAKQSHLGSDLKLRSVCVIDDQYNPLSPGWFTVDRHKSNLLITSGNALQLPHDIAPATIITYTTIYGPRKDMDELMYDYFLRILYQFLGGGSSDPTPTPTP